MSNISRVLSIDGPVISTGEMRRQRELFCDVLGLATVAEQELDPVTVRAWFGLADRTARTVLLETPGTRIGVRLVAFDPPSETIIRPGGVGVASDALKMIDFFTSDLDSARERLRARGFELVTEGADLALPDGARFTEAHVRGPDGVMVAAIQPHDRPASDFVTVTDRLFSEVQSSSGPVSDFEPVRRFYEETLGVPLGFRYEFTSDAFSSMIGAGRTTTIRANNYGRVVEDVMLGIIHYGLPPGSYESLRERARPPHRGVVAVRLTVRGLDALVARCERAGIEVAVSPAELELAPYGRVRTATVRGPHGVWHMFTEHA
jgi:catechol 2,3-dioxygenase-like lactoylglutathione lyase family enzyme